MTHFQKIAESFPDECLDFNLLCRQWSLCTAFVAAGIVCSTLIPGIKEFIDLDWKTPALIYIFSPLVEIFGLYLFQKERITRIQAFFFTLASSIFLEISFALMIAKSSWRGGVIFSIIFLFTSAYHSFINRSSLKNPYIPIGIVISISISMSLNHSLEHFTIFVVLSILSIGSSFVVGIFSLNNDKKRAENERLKLAIQAQMLTDETTRADRLTEVIKEFSSWAHDMKNYLSNAEGCLLLLSPPKDLPKLPHSEAEKERLFDLIRQHHLDLRMGLDKTGKIIQSLKTEEQQMESVPLEITIDQIINTLHCRFTNIEINYHLEKDLPKDIKLYGGKTTLHRIIENLIINACEGNGVNGASKIRVEAHALHDEEIIRISVTDNGPGFTEDQLSKPIQALQTTKDTGTGLGLYSTERLVMAHCGKLTRANNPGGGATVSLILPIISQDSEGFQKESTVFPQTSKMVSNDVVPSVSLAS